MTLLIYVQQDLKRATTATNEILTTTRGMAAAERKANAAEGILTAIKRIVTSQE
jgi:hypothetical protein